VAKLGPSHHAVQLHLPLLSLLVTDRPPPPPPVGSSHLRLPSPAPHSSTAADRYRVSLALPPPSSRHQGCN
jgi:hypothetical protein